MKLYIRFLMAVMLVLWMCLPALAGLPGTIDAPPLSERWFGIFVNNERVGFYRQNINTFEDGYKIEGNGSVKMNVMSFTKEAFMRETYLVAHNLSLRSFDVEQTVNGSSSHVSGTVTGSVIRMKITSNGTVTEKTIRIKGEIYPGPALNIYPLMHAVEAGTSFKISMFDSEDLKIKDIHITVMGEDKTTDGSPALKLRNNLYPFVTNDIWVDRQGNTLEESVRDGLVTTRAEQPEALGAFISNWVLTKKDLIYDFSLVPVEPPIKNPAQLTGLAVEVSDWNDALPLLQGGGQLAEKLGNDRVRFTTGSLARISSGPAAGTPAEIYLKPADRIESEAPEIIAQAKTLTATIEDRKEKVKALASWTAKWLKDTVDDGGSAAESFKSQKGNCQTHARLYTALARAAAIPTRFVSGLVYVGGKGFLYHSWAESFIGDQWVSVDPTYNQLPADPTHLKLLEGHLPEDMAPIIAIIGRIKITVQETAY